MIVISKNVGEQSLGNLLISMLHITRISNYRSNGK